MRDDNFNLHKGLWQFADGGYVLAAKTLPSSEKYLVTLEGPIDRNAIKNILYVKKSAGRNEVGDVDKYWLESSIKTPKILESMYRDLEVDEVNVDVKVDIQKILKLAIPDDVANVITSTQKFLAAASAEFDRNQLFRALAEYRKSSRITPLCDPNSFARLI